MNAQPEQGIAHVDRSRWLAAIGALLLLVGLGAAFVGPVEIYCFYLFSEGGRFHYEGFGFGSFMFGNIAVQVIGYYLVAGICIPLGYGHLRLRRWARPFTLVLLWCWLVTGVPLCLVILFMLFSAKDMSLAGAWIAIVLVAASYLAFPALAIRFYGGRNVRRTLAARDRSGPYAVERLPLPVLVLCALYLFYLLSLHVLLLFGGFFPLFGTFASGLQGIVLIDAAILALALLLWGTLRLRAWAWWGSLVYFTVMSVTWIWTLARATWAEILAAMDFPPFELDILSGMPFHGAHLAALVGLPLLVTLALIARARRHYAGWLPLL